MIVIIGTDQPLYITAISDEICAVMTDLHVASANSLTDLISLLMETHCDMVLLDLGLLGASGIEGVRHVVTAARDAPVLVTAGSPCQAEMIACIEAGAKAFLPKTLATPVFIAAIRVVALGGSYVPAELTIATGRTENATTTPPLALPAEPLNERERALLRMIGAGASNKEIAREVGLQEVTIKLHLSRVFRKICVRNRAQAAAFAARTGLANI